MNIRRFPTRNGVALLLLAFLLGWRILTLGFADRWAVDDPERALSWRSDQTEALHLAAATAFDSGHPLRAVELARRGIGAYPLDGRNYRVLAAQARAIGDRPQETRMLALALQRSPRDLRTHMTLAEDALQAGNAELGLRHLDAILRIEPQTEPELLPRIARLAEAPSAATAIGDLLSHRPPWRRRFLQTLAAVETDPQAVARVFTRLQASVPRSLSSDEAGYWIDRQIREGDWMPAYATWASILPDEQRAVLGNVFDGNFAFPPSAAGFDWRMPPMPGVNVRVGAMPTTGNALFLDFSGTRVASTGVMQLLALQQGAYVLRGKAMADGLATSAGLQWQLVCADGRQQLLAASPALRGTHDWDDFEVAFEVPGDACGGQWLRLQPPAPDQLDGHVAYAELAVQKQSADREPGVRLSAQNGIVLVNTGKGFVAARAQQMLAADDRILLLQGGNATLSYPDGCTISLRSTTMVIVPTHCAAATVGIDTARNPGISSSGQGIGSRVTLWPLFLGTAVPGCTAIVCRDDTDAIGLP